MRVGRGRERERERERERSSETHRSATATRPVISFSFFSSRRSTDLFVCSWHDSKRKDESLLLLYRSFINVNLWNIVPSKVKRKEIQKKHMDTHMLLIFDFSRTDHVQRMRCRAKKLEGEGFESIEIWMKIYITCVPDSKFMKMEQREYFFHVALKSHWEKFRVLTTIK